jgi:flagellar basal body-associated protein FliL
VSLKEVIIIAITAFIVLSLPAYYAIITFLGEEKDKQKIKELLD